MTFLVGSSLMNNYRNECAVEALDLDAEAGSVVGLPGANGAGIAGPGIDRMLSLVAHREGSQ